MAGYSTQDLQEEFLNVIRVSQETVVEAVKTWVDNVSAVTPWVPSIQVLLADRLPKPAPPVRGSAGLRSCRVL